MPIEAQEKTPKQVRWRTLPSRLDFPLAASTTAIGLNDSDEIAGYFTDTNNVNHGFIYSANAFIQVDVSGATQTQLTRIKNNGHITGVYVDNIGGNQHGLTGH